LIIDYVIVNVRVYNKVVDLKIEKKVDIDHLRLGLRLERKEEEISEKEGEEEKREEEKENRRSKVKEIIIREEKVIKKYKENTENTVIGTDSGTRKLDKRGRMKMEHKDSRWSVREKEE